MQKPSPDQEKTTFITPRGIFYYKVTLFGLKNAGATYQLMITKMFERLMESSMDVYIDDMVVKRLSMQNVRFIGHIYNNIFVSHLS